jgi:hypothetical protein
MMGWWTFTRSAIEALTAPVDTAAADRAVRDLARDSRLGAALHRASRIARRSWMDSRLRAAAAALAGTLAGRSAADAFRVRGWVAVVAGMTILGLYAVKPVPVGPLSSLVPSLVIVVGGLLILMAAAVARASADRHSRPKTS